MQVENGRPNDQVALRAIQEQAEELRARRNDDRVAASEAADLFDAQTSSRRGRGNPLFVDIMA